LPALQAIGPASLGAADIVNLAAKFFGVQVGEKRTGLIGSHEETCSFANPEGVPASSPGLRAEHYPG
jgi:hypothetical protein